MKKNNYRFWCNLFLVFLIVYLVYSLFFAKEKNSRMIAKSAVLIVIYGASVFGIRTRIRPNAASFKIYEDKYNFIIKNAFKYDRQSRLKLLYAINYYNNNQNEKAVKILDKIYGKTETSEEISAVLYFKALCCTETGQLNTAIDCYEELLKTDATNSYAWSNLGILYDDTGNSAAAINSYENAIRYDPENAYPYNNISTVYLKQNDVKNALNYALKSLELNSGIYQAAGTAAIAYALSGENEKAEEYFEIYRLKAKDSSSLRTALDNIMKK